MNAAWLRRLRWWLHIGSNETKAMRYRRAIPMYLYYTTNAPDDPVVWLAHSTNGCDWRVVGRITV